MEHSYSRRGFTLIELLVVLGIILVVTAVTITSQTSFDKTFVLSNTAYDIALAIRSAESFGLGSRGVGSTGNAGYGVRFDSAMPNSFILFADTSPAPSALNCHGVPPTNDLNGPDAQPGDCRYTPGSDAEINDYTLGNGITVSDFCAYVGVIKSCSLGGGLSSLDIVFARPNLDVFITGGNGPLYSAYTSACLTVTSPQGGFRYISVAPSGQITANAPSCP